MFHVNHRSVGTGLQQKDVLVLGGPNRLCLESGFSLKAAGLENAIGRIDRDRSPDVFTEACTDDCPGKRERRLNLELEQQRVRYQRALARHRSTDDGEAAAK